MSDPLNKQKNTFTWQDWDNIIFLLGTPLTDFGLSADEAAPTVLTLNLSLEERKIHRTKMLTASGFFLFLAVVVPVHDHRLISWQHSSDFRRTSVISSF